MNLAKYAWISLALCIMALILFSSIGAPLLDMSNDNMYEEVSEEVLRHLTRIVGAEGLGTTSAQGDRRLALGFNVELFPPMPNRSGPNMIKEGEEWEEFSMTEAPEPGPLSPGPGDWVVSGTEVRKNEVIILTGNLIVEPGGNLTLINCTLIMNCTYDGEWKIKVESGSIMNVLKGSVIRAYDPYYEFMFYVYGRLIMRDSELHECGYDRDHPGLWIKSDEGIMIENCTISQNDWYGIVCYRSSNIMITGCEINWNDCGGIYCRYSSNITIIDCNISRNYWGGIWCRDSLNITITGCKINQNGRGIYCLGSSSITITNCEIDQNDGRGIYCEDSLNITIIGCKINQNWHGVYCEGSSSITIAGCAFICDGVSLLGHCLSNFASHLIENNTVNGKPLYYIVDVTGPYDVPSDAGQVIIVSSKHVRLVDANLSYTDIGLEIAYSSNIMITHCNISWNDCGGIGCWSSSNIMIAGCEIGQNYCCGIGCWSYSSNITITDCDIDRNDWCGIECESSSSIMITGCEINWNDWHGIYCEGSLHTTITDCNIDHNGYGIGCWNSFNTTIIRCNITNNEEHGLYVFGFFVVSAAYNWWGSPDGPEYKAEGDPDDPEEVYNYYGPRYIIYEPWLTKPYSPIDDIPPSVIISSPEERSCIMGITVVSVDAYDNETGIVRVEFYLNETLVFTDYDYPYEYVWNTTGCPDGAYTIKVIAYDLAGNVAEHEVTVIVDNTAPSIGKSVISPKSPTEEDDVTVKVSVVDALSGVEEAILSYSTDGGATWTNVTMVLSSNGYYTATIPGQPAGTTVLYKIYARDAVGNWAVSLEYSYKVGARHVLPVSTTYILVSVAAVIAIIAIGIHRFMRRKAG